MKKSKKVLLSFVAVLFMTVLAFASFETDCYALSYEDENNNYYNKANLIDVNTSVTGSLSDKSDIDCFMFTLDTASKVDITFAHDVKNNGSSWVVKFYKYYKDSNATSDIIKKTVQSSGGKCTFAPFGLPKGDYLVEVYDNRASNYTSGIKYTLNVKATGTTSWETEFNNVYYNADKLTLGKNMYGNMTSKNDADYYLFELQSSSKVDITFDHDKKSNGSSWKIEFYKYNKDKGTTSLVISKTVQASGGKYTFASFGMPKGSYLIKIYDNDFYNHTNGIKYTLNVKATKTTSWETEFNDVYYNADKLTLNKKIIGNMTDKNDVDHYEISFAKKSIVNITFDHNKKSNGSYWKAVLYRYYKDEGTTSKIAEAKVSASSGSYVFKELSLSAGNYLIEVVDYDFYNHTDGINYAITVSSFVPQVKNVKVSARTTNAIKLTWGEATGATGYRVYKYNPKTKKYDTYKDATGKSIVLKNLKAGTKYRYIVRGFIKSGSTVIWGKPSAVFETATSPATPNQKAVSNAKGKITLAWTNVAGESGYEIYWSSKKNSGYKKLATTKADVSKVTFSAKSGGTYYFRVRAIIKTASGTVYGGYKTVGVRVK